MEQDKLEWLEVTKDGRSDYHERQYRNPYQSTIAFCKWMESLGLLNLDKCIKVADIGSGQGANLLYMSNEYPNSEFKGIELNPDLVKWGNEYIVKSGKTNCKLVEGDLYNISKEYIGAFDGIVSYQLLSWLPEFKTPLLKMIELKPDWIAMTSLFYDGNVNCKIEVEDYDICTSNCKYRKSFYNTYSLTLVRQLFEENGYKSFDFIPFEIDIDLKEPEIKGMGTYTETLKNGKRLQITGPLLLNWYFVCARK